jgi:chromosome segregation ATPase
VVGGLHVGNSKAGKAVVLAFVRRRLAERTANANTELPGLEARAAELKGEIRNLAALVAKGVDSPTIAEENAEREKRLRAVQSRIDATRTAPSVLDLEIRRLELEARKRIADLRGLCRRRPEVARRALEVLFDGPLK